MGFDDNEVQDLYKVLLSLFLFFLFDLLAFEIRAHIYGTGETHIMQFVV